MAILATMTSNIGKQLWVQELSLNFLVRGLGTATSTAVVEMPLWRQRGLGAQQRFHSKSVPFRWSPKLFPEVSHLQK